MGQEDNAKFGEKPVGSGPFVFDGPHTEQGRPFAAFVANLNYGTRPSKAGLPRFRSSV